MTKVIHISRFRERYELPDDVRLDRKGPLIYTKDFVGGGNDDESCAHGRQLMALRSKRNYLTLRGAFSELKNIAGNMSSEKRGYLLDGNFNPAKVKEIGRWLGVSEAKAQAIINDLSDVGLLEKVSLPKFNGELRARPRKSVKRRKPLNKKTKVKVKAKTNGKGKVKNIIKKRQSKNKPQNPTPTTQPIKSQNPQKGRLLVQSETSPELLGNIAGGILHRYNPEAKQFAFEIYQALKLPFDPTSEQGKRELGSFASVWQKCSQTEELRLRAISEAKKVGRRQQNKKKGAVWNHIFARLVIAQKRRSE